MEIEIVNVEPRKAISIRDNCTPGELSNKYREIYSELGKLMKKQLLHYASHPFGIYHSFSNENVDVEAGIPVTGTPAPEGRAKVISTYGGKAVCLKFYGPYSKLAEGWDELTGYIKKNNYKVSSSPFEIYVSDPEKEPDSSKLLTEIYYPIT